MSPIDLLGHAGDLGGRGSPVAEVERRIGMAREFLRARLADEYRDLAATAPTDAILAVLQGMEPSPLERARIGDRLKAGG